MTDRTETAAERAARLDEQIVKAVMASISEPGKYGEDCQQEARLAVLEAGANHSDSWYVARAVWRARDFEKKQMGSRRLVKTRTFGGEIASIDGEYHYSPTSQQHPADGRKDRSASKVARLPDREEYFPGTRRPLHDYRLWRRATARMAGYTGYSGCGRVTGVCSRCRKSHYRAGALCPECVLGTAPGAPSPLTTRS